MGYRIAFTLAALLLGLGAAAPGPAPSATKPAPAQEAWQTVCYYVYEPMFTDRGWQLVYARRCINHLALAPAAVRPGSSVT